MLIGENKKQIQEELQIQTAEEVQWQCEVLVTQALEIKKKNHSKINLFDKQSTKLKSIQIHLLKKV